MQKRKRPFNDKELEAMGMTGSKVENNPRLNILAK
jgi:hypothetical protein